MNVALGQLSDRADGTSVRHGRQLCEPSPLGELGTGHGDLCMVCDHCNHRETQPQSNRHPGSRGLSGARPLGRQPVSSTLAGTLGRVRTAVPPPSPSSRLHPRQDAPPDLLFPGTHRRAQVLRAQGASMSTVAHPAPPPQAPARAWPTQGQ